MFGLIKKYSVHMCSEVKGIITLNGNPVESVLINRSLKFAHKIEKEDQVITVSDGTFNMPEVVVESKIPGDMFSHEVTYQLITAIHGGEEYELWNSELRGIDEPDEYKQKLSSLNADLVSPNVDFIFPNHAHENLDFYGSTICRWESDFEIYETEDDDTDYFKDFK